MRVNLEIQPGQETRGDKLTISEVLAEYLRAEKSRLAPKTHVRYTEVIALFTHSLNSYAATRSASSSERASTSSSTPRGSSIASSRYFRPRAYFSSICRA